MQSFRSTRNAALTRHDDERLELMDLHAVHFLFRNATMNERRSALILACALFFGCSDRNQTSPQTSTVPVVPTPTTADPAPTPRSFCDEGELCWVYPSPTGLTLHDVWRSPDGVAWIVGEYGTVLRAQG